MKTRREFLAITSGCILPIVLASCKDANQAKSADDEVLAETQEDESTSIQDKTVLMASRIEYYPVPKTDAVVWVAEYTDSGLPSRTSLSGRYSIHSGEQPIEEGIYTRENSYQWNSDSFEVTMNYSIRPDYRMDGVEAVEESYLFYGRGSLVYEDSNLTRIHTVADKTSPITDSEMDESYFGLNTDISEGDKSLSFSQNATEVEFDDFGFPTFQGFPDGSSDYELNVRYREDWPSFGTLVIDSYPNGDIAKEVTFKGTLESREMSVYIDDELKYVVHYREAPMNDIALVLSRYINYLLFFEGVRFLNHEWYILNCRSEESIWAAYNESRSIHIDGAANMESWL